MYVKRLNNFLPKFGVYGAGPYVFSAKGGMPYMYIPPVNYYFLLWGGGIYLRYYLRIRTLRNVLGEIT